jgi:hypothetical protein
MYTADLSLTNYKVLARAEGIRLFRAMTGRRSIPSGQTYWTLCNRQGVEPDSEINQLVSEGVCTKSQFVGVDYDAALIEQNRIDHPEAKFICGEWTEAIMTDFNPALVYLDSTGTADCPHTADLCTRTMQRCPVGTVLLCNVMLTNPYTGDVCSRETLLSNIAERCTEAELDAWD